MKTQFRGVSQGRCFKILSGLAIVLACRAAPLQAIEIPPRPAIDGHGEFIQDLATLLTDAPGARRSIAAAQKVAFEKHDVPIIVVTISQMSHYGGQGVRLESFVREWFNAWEIGTMDRPGGNNRGILLLVSVVDRQARIELGGDWGLGFDKSCQQIMDLRIVPNFKKQDYAAGITAGVEALADMAAKGPSGTPPGFRSWGGWALSGPAKIMGLLGAFIEAFGQLAVLAIIVVVVVVLEWCGIEVCGSGDGDNSSGWGSGGYSGGGYSGGGFGGGSSGGGGASGSW